MKSSQELARGISKGMEKRLDHGRAIARGMELERVQKEKNMAKADRRKQTMLHQAAEQALGRSYS